MRLKLFRMAMALLALTAALTACAQKNPYVGDVPMSSKKTLVENLTASPIHTEFVRALHETQVDQTLGAGGPYTVFAPTDDALRPQQRTAPKLPPLTADGVRYYIVQGRLTLKKISKRIKKGHGTMSLQTLDGQPLTIRKYGSILVMTDAKGGTATIITPDVLSKGGVFHVIDGRLLPN